MSHRGLRWFRTLFLLALVYDSWCMATRGEMADSFGRPDGLNFVYPVAPWVRPLPAPLMEWMPHAIGGAALVALVFPCCGLAAVTGLQAYLFLCDAARYVNHHYLYILLSALLLLAAVDTPRGAECRLWHLQLLRLQLCVVYFFGGVVKCSREFLLEGEPLRIYLRAAVAAGRPLHPLQGLLDSEGAVALLAPLAALYDLLAPVALWHPWPRVRWAAVAVGVGFHGTNSLLFNTIHSFPFVCTAAYLLFLNCSGTPPPPPPQRQPQPQPQPPQPQPQPPCRARLLCSGATAAAWVAVQLLLPLRPWLQSADPSWSKLGDTFAWRMMADVRG